MSTDFVTARMVLMKDLFDGRLATYGITEFVAEGSTSPTSRCLTDGNNYLWVSGDQKVSCLTRYLSCGAPGRILVAIAEVFETDIFSEYEPQYWGFETKEAWHACLAKIDAEDETRFYEDVIRFVSGKPNDIRPETVGMCQAEIARELVSVDPGLVGSERRTELMDAVRSLYDERHTIRIELSAEDCARARLMVTHEDDLPF